MRKGRIVKYVNVKDKDGRITSETMKCLRIRNSTLKVYSM